MKEKKTRRKIRFNYENADCQTDFEPRIPKVVFVSLTDPDDSPRWLSSLNISTAATEADRYSRRRGRVGVSWNLHVTKGRLS